MSIELILRRLLHDRKLFELGSLFTGDETVRTMIVSANVSAAVEPPFAETTYGDRLAEFRAWLDAFMEGAEISVAEQPFSKPPFAMLARVCPVEGEFWSIRVTEPDQTPGIRSLGAFLGKDKFVALTWSFREEISVFENEVKEASDAWNDLFGSYKPHNGASLHEYLTNYYAV